MLVPLCGIYALAADPLFHCTGLLIHSFHPINNDLVAMRAEMVRLLLCAIQDLPPSLPSFVVSFSFFPLSFRQLRSMLINELCTFPPAFPHFEIPSYSSPHIASLSPTCLLNSRPL